MGSTASAEALDFEAITDGSEESAEDFVSAIRSLLASEQARDARRMAACAAARFAGHPWLRKADRVLNPSRITAEPAQAPDRTREFAWLRQHSTEYRGRWVALLGDDLLAAAEDLDEVLRELRGRDLETHPLVHRVA